MAAIRSRKASQAPPSRATSSGSGTRPATRAPRVPVLVVDTDSETHRLIVGALGERFQVHSAYMLAEAITLAETAEPAIVLFSVAFPAIDLLIFGRVMRERYPGVRFIGTARAGQAKDIARARQVGASAILEKPVDAAKIVEIVEAHAPPG